MCLLSGAATVALFLVCAAGRAGASSYLTVKPSGYTFEPQLATKTVPRAASLEANKVTSVLGVGSGNGSGSSTFKFVVVMAPAIPTGMPDTGFDPNPSAATTGADLTNVPAWLVVVAALIGACYLWLSRRSPSRSPEAARAAARRPRPWRRSS